MATEIDESVVRHIAHLSRLTVTDKEVASMCGELSAVVGYIDQLSRLDTEAVAPTAHALSVRDVFREDQVHPSLDPEASLKNAPQRDGEFFKVPKVLDTEGGA